MLEKFEISSLLDFYADVLTEKQQDILYQYYNEDHSLAEIAENFAITRQGVRDAVKRGEAILLELEEKIGYAKYYACVQSNLAELESLALDLNFENNNSPNKSIQAEQKFANVLKLLAGLREEQ